MKLGLLKYSNTSNIGDNIQTLAVAQHVKFRDHFVDRDFLSQYDGMDCAVVMNGWFSHEPQNWPPSPKITPIFFGFHIAAEALESFTNHRDYFKKYEPIGCRDQGTADILKSWGVDAYVSGCATMTFKSRDTTPQNGRLMLVDVDKRQFRREKREEFASFVKLSHLHPLKELRTEIKNGIAADLLQFYRDNASNVVTSRIHCALPCFAMGIPTVYCGVDEYRTKLIERVGIPRIAPQSIGYKKISLEDFNKPDYEDLKQSITNDLKTKLAQVGVETL